MGDTRDPQQPVDCQSLDRDTAIEQLQAAIAELAEKDEKLALLLHRIKQLEKMVFGPRSAKRSGPIDLAELLPFPGLDALLQGVQDRAEQRAAEAESKPPEDKPRRKRRGRRTLDDDIPPGIPRNRRQRKLMDEDCRCGCGGTLSEFKEEVSRRLEQVKILYVEERVATYYSCSKCSSVVRSAPDQESVIEGSILGPSLISDLVYQRFGNHTPYNRLAREFEQRGLPIDRTVIGRNVLKCGELLEPIYDHMRRSMLNSFLLQIDDTPLVVRNGSAKGRATGRVWVYRAPGGNVLFDFRMDRAHDGPKAMIGKFEGFIQGDAYAGHDFLFRDNDVRIELGCWAHVVRKFRDASDSDKKLAAEFDLLFALLHTVEVEAKAMSPPQRFLHRAKHARPVLNEIENWLDARLPTVLPQSPMAKAIKYARNHWQALINYLLDGRITDITNNAAERALRRVAVGRKNWIFVGAEEAGKPAVVLMSILQTCRELDVNAIEYLRDVLVRVSEPGSAKSLDELTPAGWRRSAEARERASIASTAVARVVDSLVPGGVSKVPLAESAT